MQNDINTYPIQQFISLVKNADLTNQKNIMMDIKNARILALTLGEVSAKLNQDYEALLDKIQNGSNQTIELKMDGGGFR